MLKIKHWLVLGLALWGCSKPMGIAGGQEVVLHGESAHFLGVPLSSWAVLGPDHAVREVGVTIPVQAFERAPVDAGALETHVSLQFPQEVKETTYFQFFGLDYYPAGHRPTAVYGVPHFDFHFYGVPTSEVQSVDCSDLTLPSSERMPTGYAIVPSPQEACEPRMGIHAVALNAPELRPEQPEPFSRTMVVGFYRGAMTFLEPMVTREFMLRRQSFSLNVPRPQVLGRATMYPSAFVAEYDPANETYKLRWSDFRPIR